MSAVFPPPSFADSSAAESRFDYGGLPASVARAVREQTESLHSLLGRTAATAVQIGLRLRFVRARLGRARFQPWLKAEFAWSQSAASNYMRAAEAFGELDCLERFQPGALFILARRNVPAAARAEAVRVARRGSRVTKAAARDIVAGHLGDRQVTSAAAERVRRTLLRALETLPPGDLERLAEEFLRRARDLALPPADR